MRVMRETYDCRRQPLSSLQCLITLPLLESAFPWATITCDVRILHLIHFASFLAEWRESNFDLLNLSDPIFLDKDHLEYRTYEVDLAALQSSVPMPLWVSVNGRAELIITYSDVDLQHVESGLRDRFAIQFVSQIVAGLRRRSPGAQPLYIVKKW